MNKVTELEFDRTKQSNVTRYMKEFQNHCVLDFALTSTHEATHDCVHLELSISSITVEKNFN